MRRHTCWAEERLSNSLMRISSLLCQGRRTWEDCQKRGKDKGYFNSVFSTGRHGTERQEEDPERHGLPCL